MRQVLLKFNDHGPGRPRGFGLVEVVVALAVAATVIVSLIQLWRVSLRLSRVSAVSVEAGWLLREGMEGVRFLRDAGWSANIASLASGASYYLTFDGSKYALTSAEPDFLNGKFQRTISFADVFRDSESAIAPAGSLDPSTKKVTVTLAWSSNGATTTRAVDMYLTDLFGN